MMYNGEEIWNLGFTLGLLLKQKKLNEHSLRLMQMDVEEAFAMIKIK